MSGPFTLQLQQFAAKAKERADDVVGNVVVRIAARIDERSPVGNMSLWKDVDSYNFPDKFAEIVKAGREGYVGGRFRANWQLGVGTIPTGTVNNVDPTGIETQARILAAVPDEASGKIYYLANNLPYARALEDGHSKQAPQGMVGLTVVEFETIVREAVAALP